VRCIDHPRSAFGASPSRWQHRRPGTAGSAAFACIGSLLATLFTATLLGGCSSPPSRAAATAPVVSPGVPATGSAARARNWDEFKVLAGRRMVAANPNGTFTGVVPEPLLAIPVLEIELNGDGSIRNVRVQRQPSDAPDTVQLAIDAVKRAAPYDSVSHLPRPWTFSEVFLFRDDRRFKPRALDQE
jgi:hypothetical protein